MSPASETAGSTVGTGTTSDPETVVRTFLRRLEELDLDGALELLADDVHYHNVRLSHARSRAAVRRQLGLLTRIDGGFEAHNHHVVADGPVVLTERTDVLIAGPVRVEFWVCGTFEVHDGRITLWRDRFDFLDVTVGMVKGVARAALDRLAAGR